MDERPPLIVTATPNICWLQPDAPYPDTAEAMAEEAWRCERAGAAVLHMHADDWPPMIRAVRARGLRLVTVPQLMADDPPPAGQPLPQNLGGD